MKVHIILVLIVFSVILSACQPGEKSLVKQPERLAPQPQSQPQTASSSGGASMSQIIDPGCDGGQSDGYCNTTPGSNETNGTPNNINPTATSDYCEPDCAYCLPNTLDPCWNGSDTDHHLEAGEGCGVIGTAQPAFLVNYHYLYPGDLGYPEYPWFNNWRNSTDYPNKTWHFCNTTDIYFTLGAAAQQGSGVGVSGNAVLCKLKFMRAGQGGVGQAALLCGGGSPFVLKNSGGCPYSDCGPNNGCNPNCATNPDCPSDPDCDCSSGNGCNRWCDCDVSLPHDTDCPAACDNICCVADGDTSNCPECEQCYTAEGGDPDCQNPLTVDACMTFCGDGVCAGNETWDESQPACIELIMDTYDTAVTKLPCYCEYDCCAPTACCQYEGLWKNKTDTSQPCDYKTAPSGTCVYNSSGPIFDKVCCNGNIVNINVVGG
ncbi:MAG: hypothetical protein D6797_03965 [Bdellovibrio sp.]|nr:MAG: hypothetical protein D6797_03965 [Bdellovibrio sp.]